MFFMIESLTNNLNSYKTLLKNLDSDDFCKEVSILSSSSVGQHLRHVLEFYLCLFSGLKKGEICYDERKRDLLLETDKDYAIKTIDNIILELGTFTTDTPVKLKVSLSSKDNKFSSINSTVYRELVYSFDHSVHHQALIKIGLNELNHNEIDDNFGIAPSTIKYKKECVQ
ncbi:MAG: putative damage-inducible protein DinB [Glaciecola sp.]|jgi:uncharacterized damage-inducible protein DinB